MIHLDPDGKRLARFKKWIEATPEKDFANAALAEKCGRLFLIAIVLRAVVVPIRF